MHIFLCSQTGNKGSTGPPGPPGTKDSCESLPGPMGPQGPEGSTGHPGRHELSHEQYLTINAGGERQNKMNNSPVPQNMRRNKNHPSSIDS